MKQIAVKITSQAIANQLASLTHTHNARTVDVKDFFGRYKPFKVGETAIFWLYPSNVHFTQFTSSAYPSTLEGVRPEEYQSVSELATAFSQII